MKKACLKPEHNSRLSYQWQYKLSSVNIKIYLTGVIYHIYLTYR